MPLVIDKAAYNELLIKFQPKIIETEEEYSQTHRVLLELMMRRDRSREETALLKLLIALVKEFDEKQEQLEPASPCEVLAYLMEENQIKQADLVGKIGSKGVVSEIVNGKRSISKTQAKTLAEIFRVSPAVFI
jgi:HTH-type transcriptional regulator / antitoxin HigA